MDGVAGHFRPGAANGKSAPRSRDDPMALDEGSRAIYCQAGPLSVMCWAWTPVISGEGEGVPVAA
jgi:hypothetical protein